MYLKLVGGTQSERAESGSIVYNSAQTSGTSIYDHLTRKVASPLWSPLLSPK